MSIRRFPAVALLALTAAATAASCGSSGGGTKDNSATVPAGVGLEVEAGPGIKFGKEAYTATAGTLTVALVNRDTQLHSLVIVDAAKKTLPGELEVGKSGAVDTGEYDLAAGTYTILCLVPGHENMKSTLTVS